MLLQPIDGSGFSRATGADLAFSYYMSGCCTDVALLGA
jgi:hypothetical protein